MQTWKIYPLYVLQRFTLNCSFYSFQEESPTNSISGTADSKYLCVETAGEKYSKDIRKRRSADLSGTDIKLPAHLGNEWMFF